MYRFFSTRSMNSVEKAIESRIPKEKIHGPLEKALLKRCPEAISNKGDFGKGSPITRMEGLSKVLSEHHESLTKYSAYH